MYFPITNGVARVLTSDISLDYPQLYETALNKHKGCTTTELLDFADKNLNCPEYEEDAVVFLLERKKFTHSDLTKALNLPPDLALTTHNICKKIVNLALEKADLTFFQDLIQQDLTHEVKQSLIKSKTELCQALVRISKENKGNIDKKPQVKTLFIDALNPQGRLGEIVFSERGFVPVTYHADSTQILLDEYKSLRVDLYSRKLDTKSFDWELFSQILGDENHQLTPETKAVLVDCKTELCHVLITESSPTEEWQNRFLDALNPQGKIGEIIFTPRSVLKTKVTYSSDSTDLLLRHYRKTWGPNLEELKEKFKNNTPMPGTIFTFLENLLKPAGLTKEENDFLMINSKIICRWMIHGLSIQDHDMQDYRSNPDLNDQQIAPPVTNEQKKTIFLLALNSESLLGKALSKCRNDLIKAFVNTWGVNELPEGVTIGKAPLTNLFNILGARASSSTKRHQSTISP